MMVIGRRVQVLPSPLLAVRSIGLSMVFQVRVLTPGFCLGCSFGLPHAVIRKSNYPDAPLDRQQLSKGKERAGAFRLPTFPVVPSRC